jgi:hypothetical protein
MMEPCCRLSGHCVNRVALLWRVVQKTLRNDPKQHEGRMAEAESNQQLPTCALSIETRVKHAL